MYERWQRWQDWASVVVGVLLFVTPFVFGATDMMPAAWVAYIGGAVLVIVGIGSLSSPKNQSLEWTEAVVGVLMFVAPFVFGFTGLSTIAWSAWIAGILAVLLAGSVLLAERGDRSMLVGQR
jgi:hypothetical protein